MLFGFAMASLLIELTPGPNMTYIAIVTLKEGRRAGFATVAGVALGLSIIGIAGALGASALINASPAIYQTLRWAGIVFLLYLAWDAWQTPTKIQADENKPDGRHFMRGLLTNVLNPKAMVFYIAVLPTFIDPELPISEQTALLTLIYVAVATLVHAMIVLLAGVLRPMLDGQYEQITRRILAILLALVAFWFASSTAS